MAYFKEVCRKKDHKQTNDVLIIEDKLGGGWVAEETVAIAVYCSLAHFNDFEKAMVAAVNHSGDSDSTGAVTGNLLGVVFGYEALPDFYKEDLELHDVILHIADDLYNGKKTEYKR
ncbi:ADP-ribosylglycohydrolase family protein [Phocaeicola barnesiae]|uniref:ADP-ribosylglycohydrolase family protein n=1 Tax=Phocaeicola barnesiae TaxID=376804 RepID=UPI00266F035F|nr:ADP-ribosylglycohydrolase family protein [Phocaeicola barnesiae]